LIRKLNAVGATFAMLASLSTGSVASGASTVLKNPLGPERTAKEFLQIAYTWNREWAGTGGDGPSIGKRDVEYAAAAVDIVLNHVYVGPDSMAHKESWTPVGETELSTGTLSDGVTVFIIRVSIKTSMGSRSGFFTIGSSINVKEGKNGWKTVGATLLSAVGPPPYCHIEPAAQSYCLIYPLGLN
jgi:hypothetical protein